MISQDEQTFIEVLNLMNESNLVIFTTEKHAGIQKYCKMGYDKVHFSHAILLLY